MQDLPSQFTWHVVHACMYGSKRFKKTAFMINFLAPNLRQLCDGKPSAFAWSHEVVVDPGESKETASF